jgi:hypothetical protein
MIPPPMLLRPFSKVLTPFMVTNFAAMETGVCGLFKWWASTRNNKNLINKYVWKNQHIHFPIFINVMP